MWGIFQESITAVRIIGINEAPARRCTDTIFKKGKRKHGIIGFHGAPPTHNVTLPEVLLLEQLHDPAIFLLNQAIVRWRLKNPRSVYLRNRGLRFRETPCQRWQTIWSREAPGGWDSGRTKFQRKGTRLINWQIVARYSKRDIPIGFLDVTAWCGSFRSLPAVSLSLSVSPFALSSHPLLPPRASSRRAINRSYDTRFLGTGRHFPAGQAPERCWRSRSIAAGQLVSRGWSTSIQHDLGKLGDPNRYED